MFLRILAYFVPFAINFLTGGFFFITSYRFAQAGCPGFIVGGAVAAWGIAYCLVTFIVGKFASVKNALQLILTGGVILTLTSAGFIVFFEQLYSQFAFLVMAGCGAAIFCTPFQLLAKSIEGGSKVSGVVSATAFYTFTWSLGFASGPLAFARLAPKSGFYVTLFLALAVTASVVVIKLLLNKQKSSDAVTNLTALENSLPQGTSFNEKTFTKLAVLGWIVGGLGTVTVCQVRAMWPKLGGEMDFSRDHIAYILALVSYAQAFTALVLCRSKCWMWKPLPALLMSVCGITALLIFASGKALPHFYLAAFLYGIYTGCSYFYLVYHSLAHPSRSGFFVAGNEIIVGITSMLSPLLGGLLADGFKFTGAAFVFAAAVAFIALIAQLIMLNPSKLAR